MGVKVKRTHSEHLYQVARDNGVSESVAKAIVTAYLQDLRDSVMAGESISVPNLFSITVSTNGGVSDIRGRVSTALKVAVRGW